MTIFIQCRLTVFIFLLALVGTNSGCDLGTYAQRAESSAEGYTAPVVTAPAAAPEPQKKKEGQPDGPDITGSWAMDGEETALLTKRQVHHVVLGGPAGKNKVVRLFKEGQMNFELMQDGTFTVMEVMDGVKSNYRGNWTLNGYKVALNQTHKGNKPEKDSLSGTVSGNEMNLSLPRGPIEFPIVLKRK